MSRTSTQSAKIILAQEKCIGHKGQALSSDESVDVEQLMQRVEEQFLKMGQEWQERALRFYEKQLRERCELLEQVEKERSPSY